MRTVIANKGMKVLNVFFVVFRDMLCMIGRIPEADSLAFLESFKPWFRKAEALIYYFLCNRIVEYLVWIGTFIPSVTLRNKTSSRYLDPILPGLKEFHM